MFGGDLKRFVWAFAGLVITVFPWFFGDQQEPGAVGVAALLLLPWLLWVCAILSIKGHSWRKHCTIWVLLFLFVNSVGWLLYNLSLVFLFVAWSWVLLSFVMIMIVILFGLSAALVEGGQRSDVITGMKGSAAGTLFAAVCVFVCLTYSLAFSVALEDRSRRTGGESPSLFAQTISDRWVRDEYCQKLSGKSERPDFRFQPEVDRLLLDMNDVNEIFIGEDEYSKRCVSSEEPEDAGELGVSALPTHNACEMYVMARALACFNPSTEARVRISAFYSEVGKRDLALQRIESTKAKILEWVEDTGSGRSPAVDFSTPGATFDAAGVDRVIVALEQVPELMPFRLSPAPPSLLDYLYFMIYTVTTTGYGDIIPVSPFARFVSSVANLAELLFIVIFFNIVLSVVSAAGSVKAAGLAVASGGELAPSAESGGNPITPTSRSGRSGKRKKKKRKR